MNIDEAPKFVGDAVSAGVVVGAIVNWLPAVAAILSIVWTVIRIYETKTVQKWLTKSKSKG